MDQSCLNQPLNQRSEARFGEINTTIQHMQPPKIRRQSTKEQKQDYQFKTKVIKFLIFLLILASLILLGITLTYQSFETETCFCNFGLGYRKYLDISSFIKSKFNFKNLNSRCPEENLVYYQKEPRTSNPMSLGHCLLNNCQPGYTSSDTIIYYYLNHLRLSEHSSDNLLLPIPNLRVFLRF